jgi:hypothetical protein
MVPHRQCTAEVADGEDDTAQHLLMQELDTFHHSEEQFLPSYFSRTAKEQYQSYNALHYHILQCIAYIFVRERTNTDWVLQVDSLLPYPK